MIIMVQLYNDTSNRGCSKVNRISVSECYTTGHSNRTRLFFKDKIFCLFTICNVYIYIYVGVLV